MRAAKGFAEAVLLFLVWVSFHGALQAQESPYLYGIHDHDTNIQEYLNRFSSGGVTGWVTATIAIGANPSDTGGDDFTWIANQGHTVIVRLNYGYCGQGNIPTPDKYDAFAQRAANYVAATKGASLFVIGNETNLGVEWPPVNGHAKYVSPQDYASLFRKVYNKIKAVKPGAKVLSQALAPFAGPFSAGSTCGYTHDANPLNWVQYMNQMLTAIKSTGGIDGIALHINSRGYKYSDIHSTQRVVAGGQSLSFSFYVYKDWVDFGIPKDLYHLPLYATEANGVFYWSGGHPENPNSRYEPGWMQEVYAEIHRYNQQAAASGKPIYRAVNMYRWCAWCDGWNINGSPYKGQILTDLDQAIQPKYRWPTAATPPPPPPPAPSGTNVAKGSINWLASSVFSSTSGGTKAYDGVISAGSKWTSNGSSAESWLALDLGASFDVTGFIVRHAGAGGEPAYYNTQAYRLERGDSLTGPWTTLATVNNANQAPSTTTTLASPQSMRWVRLYITDAGIDNYARIPEFEVYGTAAAPPPPPPPPPPPSGTNVARNSVGWSASSTFNADSAGNKAYDGVISAGSKWTSNGSTVESWLALDLGASFDVTSIIVRHAGAGGEPAYFNTEAFRLETGTSLSGPWTTAATVVNTAQANVSTTTFTTPKTTRFVRLYITDAGIDNYARIPELEVYGTATPAPPPPPPPSGTNVARNSVGWSASSTFNADSAGNKAYDGVISAGSKWTSNGSTVESWLALDLGASFDVTSIIVRHAGAGGEPAYFNTQAFRLETGTSLSGPWTTAATVANTAQANVSTTTFTTPKTTRFVRLYITDAGIDNYARIPELEVYGTAAPPPPPAGNLVTNGTFDTNLSGWTVWNERGNGNATVASGKLQMSSIDHNGGVYQQFATGGAGSKILVSGFWESSPTVANNQWAEVLVINGGRLPVNGKDVSTADADVVLLFKNDTWATPGGWSGTMSQTAPVKNVGSFVAAGATATLILKSGNVGGKTTGTRFDDIVVQKQASGGVPTAVLSANPKSGTAPLTVSFDGSGSSDPDGDPLSYSWSFGDGSSGSGKTTSHTYLSAGTFTATLTVNDGKGGSGSASVAISVTAGNSGSGATWKVAEAKSCSGACDFAQIKADLNSQGKDIGFVKIGFHVSPTGNQTGLGAWEQTLHGKGVPFFLKSVDSAGQIFEAVKLKAASGCVDNSRSGGAAGCVPHQLVYRRSVPLNPGWNPDVPYQGSPQCSNPPPASTPYQQIYSQTPKDAAALHWQRHRAEFPPELLPYKHLIWIETINEINRGGTCGAQGEPFPHNVGLVDPVFGQYTKESEWIADFAIETAKLAMAEGFNWAAFGWSSGEPEIGSWAGPKMREFLELAAANPARVAIATHEYSYTIAGLELTYPSLLGRFQDVFQVADYYGIGRPTIVITEFGWTLNNIPGVSQAMNVDLPWAAKLYAPHHEIQGAAIWYLGSGWGGIDNKVQQLIAPMADYATRNYFVLVPAGSN